MQGPPAQSDARALFMAELDPSIAVLIAVGKWTLLIPHDVPCTKGNIITRLTNHPQLAGHPALASRPKECRNALERYVKAGYLQAGKLASTKRGAGAESSYSLTKSGARLLQSVEAKWAATIQQPVSCEMNQHGATSGESSPTVASGLPLVPAPVADSALVDALATSESTTATATPQAVPDVLTPVAAVSPVRSSNVADAVLDFFEGTGRPSGIATAGSCSGTALRPRIMETAADAFFGEPSVAAVNSNGSVSGDSHSPERSEALLCPTTQRDGPLIRRTTKTLRDLRRRESKVRASITELSVSEYASLRSMAEDDRERLARRVTEERKKETKASTESVETQTQAKQLKWEARRAAKRLAIESAAEVGRARIVGQEESALSKLERRASRDALAILLLLEGSHRVAIAEEEEVEFMDWVTMECESKLPRKAMAGLRVLVEQAMLTVPQALVHIGRLEGQASGLSAEAGGLLCRDGPTAEALSDFVMLRELLVQRLRDAHTKGTRAIEVARRVDHLLGGACPMQDGNITPEIVEELHDVTATWNATGPCLEDLGQQVLAAWSRTCTLDRHHRLKTLIATTSEKAHSIAAELRVFDVREKDDSPEVMQWQWKVEALGEMRGERMSARFFLWHNVCAAQLEAEKVDELSHQIDHFIDSATSSSEATAMVYLMLENALSSLATSARGALTAAASWSKNGAALHEQGEEESPSRGEETHNAHLREVHAEAGSALCLGDGNCAEVAVASAVTVDCKGKAAVGAAPPAIEPADVQHTSSAANTTPFERIQSSKDVEATIAPAHEAPHRLFFEGNVQMPCVGPSRTDTGLTSAILVERHAARSDTAVLIDDAHGNGNENGSDSGNKHAMPHSLGLDFSALRTSQALSSVKVRVALAILVLVVVVTAAVLVF